MTEANRLFSALANSSVVSIELIEPSNEFLYHYLERWKHQAESLISLISTVEVERKHKPTEFYFLDGEAFRASCIQGQDRFYIGFRISAILRVFDLYIHVVNREKYLSDALPQGDAQKTEKVPYTPLAFSPTTIATFPREAPLSSSHLEAAIRLSFIALEFMLWHELTHLWDGHGPYKQFRKNLGNPLSTIELRTLEWEADRLSASRMMLMYRAGEHAIPMAKALASAVDGKAGETLFEGTIASPRIYVRCVIFTLLLFFWNFNEKVNHLYLDKTYPYHAARSFYFVSELGRVLIHWVYEPWNISIEEYLHEISGPVIQEAVACWDEMTGKQIGTENMSSAIHQPFALRDLKRFEEVSSRITADIRKHELAI